MQPIISGFLDAATETISHVVCDPDSRHAAIIDPVLNYNPRSGAVTTVSADLITDFVKERNLEIDWILETHAHADHLSAARLLRDRFRCKVAIGHRIDEVQKHFMRVFNMPGVENNADFDYFFSDHENFTIGNLNARALPVPGHTPADMAYHIGDVIFVGDTLFMPDVGTARCDFPGGNARDMYRSIKTLLAFPRETRLFMCHDYPPAGRTHQWQTTVGEQRDHNIHIRDGISEEAFVEMRNQRDAGLELPTLIIPSLQVNIRAGNLPAAESNGVSYLKIPLNTF